jgi:hypothetical protein
MISLRHLQDVWIVLRRGTILCGTESGESKDVDGSVMSEHKPKLLELISPYEPRNIYNTDETGLFFRALPTKSLVVKGEKCTGVKMSKKDLQCYCVGIWWEN